MFRDIHLRVEDSKAETLVSFLKELDFVEVKKTDKKEEKGSKKNKKKTPEYAYFGACPDWEMDAKELRATSNRKKAQW
jgi:ribosomal protein L11 methylase PrmA